MNNAFLTLWLLSGWHPGPQISAVVSNAAPQVLTAVLTTWTNVHEKGTWYWQTNFDTCLVASRYGAAMNGGNLLRLQSMNTNVARVTSSGTIDYVAPGNAVLRIVGSDADFNQAGFYREVNVSTSLQQTVTHTFQAYDAGSMAEHVLTGMQALVTGSFNLGRSAMWASRNAAQTNYVRNPSFFLSGMTGITAISAAHWPEAPGHYAYQGPGCAIAPRWVYFAAHYPVAAGGRLDFVTWGNTVVSRTVTNVVDVGGDAAIGALDAELPDSIGFLKVLPADAWTNRMPAVSLDLPWSPGVQGSWFKALRLPVFEMGQDQVVWVSEVGVAPNVALVGGELWFPGWSMLVRGGDSGSPVLMLVRGELVLVTGWTTGLSGPDVASYAGAMGAAGCGVMTVDLQGFGSY